MGVEEPQRIPTNIRMLLLLEALVDRADAATPAELARDVNLPKQTVHRLCTVLLEEGFLAREDAGGGLRPGRRARELAAGLLYASPTHVARRQVLEQLAETVGETVNFVVPADGGMAYRDRVETRWPFRIQLPIGSTVPFHCTASGKTYLSTLSRAEQRRLVGVMPLPRFTDNTITGGDAFLAELHRTARRGYAIDNEEFHDGMVAIAVPIKTQNGRYIASLAFHGPTQRLTMERAISLAPELTRSAATLSDILS